MAARIAAHRGMQQSLSMLARQPARRARALQAVTPRSRRAKFASRLDPHEAVDLRAEVDTETVLAIPRRHRRHPEDGLDVAAFAGAERRAPLAGALNPRRIGCAPPSTRRAIRVSSSVVTASRRSSSVARGSRRASARLHLILSVSS